MHDSDWPFKWKQMGNAAVRADPNPLGYEQIWLLNAKIGKISKCLSNGLSK